MKMLSKVPKYEALFRTSVPTPVVMIQSLISVRNSVSAAFEGAPPRSAESAPWWVGGPAGDSAALCSGSEALHAT